MKRALNVSFTYINVVAPRYLCAQAGLVVHDGQSEGADNINADTPLLIAVATGQIQ